MVAFFQQKRSVHYGVIIEIGSGSVSAGIVLSDYQKALPEVVYVSEESLPVRNATTPVEDIRAMRHALFSVMCDLEQRGMVALRGRASRARVNKILVSCTAPWSHTVTQMIHLEQDTPFTVTPRMVDQIIAHAYEKEEAHALEHAKILKDEGQHIVEKSVIDIMLNGYSVPDPYNKEATEITIAHVRGLVPISILAILADVEKHIPSGIDVQIHTSALIRYCALRDLYPQTKNALIVAVSSEATEVALMQNGILYESITVAYGMHSLIRDVADLCKTIPEEARGYVRGYKQKVLTDAQEKMLARAQKAYSHSLETAFHELTLRYVLPRTIFLIPDQDMEQFFIDTVKNALRDKDGKTNKTIILLSAEGMRHLITTPSDVSIDPRLALTACFFHKVHACGVIYSNG